MIKGVTMRFHFTHKKFQLLSAAASGFYQLKLFTITLWKVTTFTSLAPDKLSSPSPGKRKKQAKPLCTDWICQVFHWKSLTRMIKFNWIENGTKFTAMFNLLIFRLFLAKHIEKSVLAFAGSQCHLAYYSVHKYSYPLENLFIRHRVFV